MILMSKREQQKAKLIEKQLKEEIKQLSEENIRLSEEVLKLNLACVTQRSELLIDFSQSMEAYEIHESDIEVKEGVTKYLKSINCG